MREGKHAFKIVALKARQSQVCRDDVQVPGLTQVESSPTIHSSMTLVCVISLLHLPSSEI